MNARRMGTATAGKTGQRERGDHRVGRGKTERLIEYAKQSTEAIDFVMLA